MMTPLDHALDAVQEGRSPEGDYYNLFLNSDIYIPTWDMPEQPGVWTVAGKNETVRPVIIEKEEGNYIMMFDTPERLGNWAQREIGYIGMSGIEALRTFGSRNHWCLNVGTDFVKVFVPSELDWLLSNAQMGA